MFGQALAWKPGTSARWFTTEDDKRIYLVDNLDLVHALVKSSHREEQVGARQVIVVSNPVAVQSDWKSCAIKSMEK